MSNLIKKIIICSLILIFVCIIYILSFLQYAKNNNDWYYKSYNDISDYKIAKKNIDCNKCIKHFPKIIPSYLKNVQFYQYSNYWWGSEGIFLKFKVNKDYIKNEFKNKKFTIVVDKNSNFFYDSERNSIQFNKTELFDIDDFKFFVIEKSNNKEFGIAINDKNNEVLYYYIKPD